MWNIFIWIRNWFSRKSFDPKAELALLSENVSRVGGSIHLHNPEETIFDALKHCELAQANVSRLLGSDLDPEVVLKVTKVGSSLSQLYSTLDGLSESLAPDNFSASGEDTLFMLSKQKHKVHEIASVIEGIKS